MTGQHLVLCDGPADEARAFRGAYADYLATCCRDFLMLGSELPPALRGAHGPIADLVRRALALDEPQLLHCFTSSTVGTPLCCLRVRDDLPTFRARIDDAVAEASLGG